MSKAAELAALIGSQTALSNRNLIINGAMQVAQRGTSQTATGYGSIDRMALSLSGATATMTQETFTLGQTDIPSQFRNYLRVATTTGDNYCGVYHRIENVDIVEGQVTLSFYAKGTNPSGGSFAAFLYQNFGTGGSTGVLTSEQSFTTTSSWQRFEFVFTLPSLSGKTIGAGSHIEINITQPVLDTGTDAWTLDITGIQMEVGEQATPFEHRSFADELARCQRYYQETYAYGTAAGTATLSGMRTTGGADGGETTGFIEGEVRMYPSMRAAPSIVIYDQAGTTSKCTRLRTGIGRTDGQTIATSNSNEKSFHIFSTGTALGSNIQVHYTVDAEL